MREDTNTLGEPMGSYLLSDQLKIGLPLEWRGLLGRLGCPGRWRFHGARTAPDRVRPCPLRPCPRRVLEIR